MAIDNGDATNLEWFQAKERNAYNGLCLVIVPTKAGVTEEISLKAQADGLTGGEITITTRSEVWLCPQQCGALPRVALN